MVMPLSYIPVHALRISLFIICCLICSCKKDNDEINCIKIDSGTDADLTSIRNLNDTLYITGNSGFQGTLLFSADHGSSWQISNNGFETGLNDVCLLNNSFFAAADGFKIYRSDDSRKSWFPVWIQGTISLEYKTDIRSIGSTGDKYF